MDEGTTTTLLCEQRGLIVQQTVVFTLLSFIICLEKPRVIKTIGNVFRLGRLNRLLRLQFPFAFSR